MCTAVTEQSLRPRRNPVRMSLIHRGRVKRRSPPIIGQFTVAVGMEAVRRLRIHYPESNKIAHFHQGNEFSHGLHPLLPRFPHDKGWTAVHPFRTFGGLRSRLLQLLAFPECGLSDKIEILLRRKAKRYRSSGLR